MNVSNARSGLKREMSLHFTRFWRSFQIGIQEILPEIGRNIPNYDQRNFSRNKEEYSKLRWEKYSLTLVFCQIGIRCVNIPREKKRCSKCALKSTYIQFQLINNNKKLPFNELSLSSSCSGCSVCFLWSKKKMFPQYCLSSFDKAVTFLPLFFSRQPEWCFFIPCKMQA